MCAIERYNKWYANKRNRIDAREALANPDDFRIYEVNRRIRMAL